MESIACLPGVGRCGRCTYCLLFGSLIAFMNVAPTYSQYKLTQNNNYTVCPRNTYLDPKHSSLLGYDVKLQWYLWLHKTFPRCWQSLQYMLCFTTKKRRVKKQCQLFCFKALQSCQMMFILSNSTVEDFLECSSMPKICNGTFPKVSKERCGSPLLSSTFVTNWVISWSEKNLVDKSIKYGCSVPCDSKFRRHKAKDVDVYPFIVVCGGVGILTSLFTMASFLIDWKCQKRYPAVILFILNVCFIFFILGWILQFFDSSNSIGCTSKGDRRMNEPRSKSGFLCTSSFVLIYSSSIAISCWFCVLTYAWYISFKALGSTKDVIKDRVTYFHLFSWSITLLLTMLVMLFGVVDAAEITNICFVNYKNKLARNVFLLVPYLSCFLIGELFLILGMKELIKVRADCQLFVVPKAAANITQTIYRLGFYGISMIVAVFMPLGCILHEGYMQDDWRTSYSNYTRCVITAQSRHTSSCVPPSDIRLSYLYLHVIGFSIACITTSSWTWTHATLKIWHKVWKRFRKVDARQRLQLSWYARMNRKKISPFIPPVNPRDPLRDELPKQLSNRMQHGEPTPSHSLHNLLEGLNNRWRSGEKRRSSDDVRSVADLFSARRGSRLSISSFESLRTTILPHRGLNMLRSKSLNNIQALGHLASNHSPPRRPSTNLTVMKVSDRLGKQRSASRLSMDDLKHLHDNLYTPLSFVHKDNIVADCIPNFSTPRVRTTAKQYNRVFKSTKNEEETTEMLGPSSC